MNKKTLIRIIESATNITKEHDVLMKIASELRDEGKNRDALILANSIKGMLDYMQVALDYFNDKYLMGELKPLEI